MPHLEKETARARTAVQAADQELAMATARVQEQQQTIAGLQQQAGTAHSNLTQPQAQLPALQSAAEAANQKVSEADAVIARHSETEPERFIERPNKPPIANPEWRVWKQRMDQLTQQQSQAAAAAATAGGRLNDLHKAIAAAQRAIQAIEAQITQANAAMVQLNKAAAMARQKSDAAHQDLKALERFTADIAREPMDRPSLETTSEALSLRVVDLEHDRALAEIELAVSDATLASLLAQRDELTARLSGISSQLASANAEVEAADAELASMAAQIEEHISGGP
jgi:chromosome segregation ATPase